MDDDQHIELEAITDDRPPPLWMPHGSVRAILALSIVWSAIAGVFLLPPEAAGLLLGVAGVVSTWYFKSKENGG
jgi:hypothetical protein